MYQKMQDGEDDFTNYNLNFRFLYFFDADDKGISTRVKEINEELKLNDKLSHSEIKEIDSCEWGCYIFHKDKDSGDLEDIILDLMKPNNETIFNNSSSFLTNNPLDEKRCRRFKEKKSIISIAGQLQFSGVNNSVIISKSDYITCTDISDNEQCQEIIKLFQSKNE
ncbi:MAG: hypothetical protein JJV94_04405 [Sulfurospirillum sp.]|nr:hypothetical protein [Sulfurospirillum sp.]